MALYVGQVPTHKEGLNMSDFMLIERILIVLVGGGMFAHFICMATAAPKKSSIMVLVFLMLIVFFSAGMVSAALSNDVKAMFFLLIGGICSMFLFWLWLWYQGMHVKDFLDKKYGEQP